MTKRATKKSTIQVFVVSWFPIYAREAAKLQCISRESAERTVRELQESFTSFPAHDPMIHVDRTEVRTTC